MDECGLPNPLRGVDWLRYNRSTLDPALRAEWEKAIAAFFRTRTRAEIRIEGRRRGINACVVEARVMCWQIHICRRAASGSAKDGMRMPGRFARVTQAARPGADRCASRHSHAQRSAGRRAHPRLLLGTGGFDHHQDAGRPGRGRHQGGKPRSRPCLSRLDVQVSASRADDLDDKPWYAHLNTSKRSLTLDLKRPESREVLEPLIGWADAVVENFSPGTMDKLGLGLRAALGRHPGLVMASGSVYGQTGPLAPEWGVDGTGGALSGRTFLTGWADRDPVVPGAVPYGDVIVPYVMAACIAAALAQRRVQGARLPHRRLDVRDLRAADACGHRGRAARHAPQRMGNADPAVLSQDVYPARGEDRWIAISCLRCRTSRPGSQRWRAVGQLPSGPREHEDHALVAQLQAAGIAAGVLQDIEDLLERDPQLRARGALVELPHPRLGAFGHMRTPISFSVDQVDAVPCAGDG